VFWKSDWQLKAELNKRREYLMRLYRNCMSPVAIVNNIMEKEAEERKRKARRLLQLRNLIEERKRDKKND
jgi:hypothetical protein